MKIKIAATSTLAFMLTAISAYSFWVTLDAWVGLWLLPKHRPFLSTFASTLTWGLLLAILALALAAWLAPTGRFLLVPYAACTLGGYAPTKPPHPHYSIMVGTGMLAATLALWALIAKARRKRLLKSQLS
jgi:hypothetical protein